jgi:hypothetical protein
MYPLLEMFSFAGVVTTSLTLENDFQVLAECYNFVIFVGSGGKFTRSEEKK